MNATQRLIQVIEDIAPRTFDREDDLPRIMQLIAAAKEEQARVLTDDEIKRLRNDYFLNNGDAISPTNRANGFADGLRYARDNGYLATAKDSGLTVEGAIRAATSAAHKAYNSYGPDSAPMTWGQWSAKIIRKALEDLAENSSDNLRNDE